LTGDTQIPSSSAAIVVPITKLAVKMSAAWRCDTWRRQISHFLPSENQLRIADVGSVTPTPAMEARELEIPSTSPALNGLLRAFFVLTCQRRIVQWPLRGHIQHSDLVCPCSLPFTKLCRPDGTCIKFPLGPALRLRVRAGLDYVVPPALDFIAVVSPRIREPSFARAL